MGFSVENICGFLIRGRLMAPDAMRTMLQRWQAQAGADAAVVPAFLKWIVASGYVTEYQATLLGQGHADDFFLNQYKILERIGRGRMAGVFKAVHNLGQVVAIKVLPPSRAKNAELLARFRREARLAMRLQHPNVVRSFQVGEANGLNYLVMEHLDGETLEDLLRRRKTLPPAEAVRLAHQTLLGLQHIHEQGMVHRDLKPANLFLQAVTKDRQPADCLVKILDIGLAREFFEDSPAGADAAAAVTELTREGVLLGTPDYLAPEQARDPRRSDIRADVYSVGCVLYAMLAGQTPFPDSNLLSQIVRHATEEPKSLRALNPAVPEGLEQIVAWMMAKQPEKRYLTPGRAAQALEVFLLVGNEPPPAEPPQMRRFLTWLELEDKDAPPKPKSSPAVPVPLAAPVKPKTSPAIPIPPLDAIVVPATPAPRRAEAKKARPVLAAPVAPAPDEIDVELVAAPAGRNKAVVAGAIAGALVLFCVCVGVATMAIRWFSS